jgi:hypothetical protein
MLDKQVFIPCKHFHYERNIIKHVNARNVSHSPMFAGFGFSNDILGNYNSIDDSPMFAGFNAPSNNTMNDKIADDWGHDIYLYNIPNARFKLNGVTSSNEKIWDGKNPLQLHKINFDFDVLKVFDKLKIVGRHPNVDLFITV